MRYLKIIISAILALIIATMVIWSGIFVILLSLIAAPVLAWWVKKKADSIEIPTNKSTLHTTMPGRNPAGNTDEESYKIIEAEYEIIEK